MTELASARQRVWFRLRPDIRREDALNVVAGLLLQAKPDGAAILSLALYAPSEGADPDDPAVETFMWELQYSVNESQGRDWDWGHEVNADLAKKVRRRLEDPASD